MVILFGPSGSIYQVWVAGTGAGGGGSALISQPIFLLVGKRERMLNVTAVSPQTADNRPLWVNWQDLENLWVVINPQTGLVTTGEVAPGTSVDLARRLALDAQSMGGR